MVKTRIENIVRVLLVTVLKNSEPGHKMTYLYILCDLATLIDIHESSSVLLIENCNCL